MNHFIYSLGSCLIFFVRFTLCIINDTELSDSWDNCEAFHSGFNSSNEILNESVTPANLSEPHEPDRSNELTSAMRTVIPGETYFITTSPWLFNDSNQWEELIREWQYNVPEETLIDTTIPHHPQPLNQSESTTPLLIDASYQLEELLSELQHKVPEKTLIGTTIPHQPPPSNQRESRSEMHNDIAMTEPQKKVTKQRKFVTIGFGSKDAWGAISSFKTLNPGISTAYKISEDQVKEILHSLGNKHQWNELSYYPIQDYYGYWANVCDYFWVKTTPTEELFRGCYANTNIFPDSTAHIEYMHGEISVKSGDLEILRCQCYFYSHYYTKPNFTIFHFAVHKYRNNEYFILKKIKRKKSSYSVTDLLTHVYLPDPQKIIVIRESNQLEVSGNELQRYTEMNAVPQRDPMHRNLPRRKFLTIGSRSKTDPAMLNIFQKIIPGKSNRQNLSEEQLEMEFISQKNINQWKELKQYSLDMHVGYWGNVCDYFWMKPKPDDKRFRGCWVRMSYQPHSHVTVVLTHISDVDKSRKLDVLQCQCYYYIKYQTQPDSNQTDFAVYKHRDNEYFVLDKVPDRRYEYKIVDFLTEVYLPDPVD